MHELTIVAVEAQHSSFPSQDKLSTVRITTRAYQQYKEKILIFITGYVLALSRHHNPAAHSLAVPGRAQERQQRLGEATGLDEADGRAMSLTSQRAQGH